MPAARSKTAQKETAKQPVKQPVKQETIYGEKEAGALSGNLTRDFELRFTASGRAVASSSIATNDRIETSPGVWENTETEYYNVSVWGQQAERAAERLLKGQRVVCTGYYQDRTYTGSDGEQHTVTEFTAQDIGPSFLFTDWQPVRASRSAR